MANRVFHMKKKDTDTVYSQYYLNEVYSDITFVVGPERRRVPGHKIILDVNGVKVYYDFAPIALVKELSIDGVSYEAFLRFLEYCYKGIVELDDKDTGDFLILALRFNIQELIELCEDYLSDKVEFVHSLELPKFIDILNNNSKLSNDSNLKMKILDYFQRNLLLICRSNYAYKLPHEIMKEIVQMDNLNCDEMLIFDIMIKWAKHKCERSSISPTSRNLQITLRHILYEIRFPIMKIEWFVEILINYPGLLTFDEQTNIFKFITKESQTCDKFNCNLRKCGYAPVRNAQTFDMYHGTLQRLACCSDKPNITGNYSSELSIKFKCTRSSKKMIGFGTYTKNREPRILSCTMQSESSSAVKYEVTSSKTINWPICWKVDYKEEYFTEPMQLQPNISYTLRVKFNEEVPILHSTVSQDSSENEIFAGEQNNVIPFLLFG